MRKLTLVKSAFAVAMAALLALPASVYAMPTDIKEAVTSDDYDAYALQNDYSYDDDELLDVDGEYVATAKAMIRVSPFGKIIDKTVPGVKYHVTGECQDCMWYQVEVNGEKGYVYTMYLVPEDEYNEDTGSNSDFEQNIKELDLEMTVTNAKSVNVRTKPSSSGDIIGKIKEGEDVEVTGNVLTTNWYQVEYKGKTGYVCDDYLTPDFPQTMACQANSLNIRSKASNSGKVVGKMKYGDKVRVSDMDGDWYKIALDDGTIGYVYSKYLSVVK